MALANVLHYNPKPDFFPVFSARQSVLAAAGLAALTGLAERYRARHRRDAAQSHRGAAERVTMAIPFVYSMRSIAVRKGSSAMAVGGIALVVVVFVTLLSLAAGFRKVVESSGAGTT